MSENYHREKKTKEASDIVPKLKEEIKQEFYFWTKINHAASKKFLSPSP
jgi:hypothetical protein